MQRIYRHHTENVAVFTSHVSCSKICEYLKRNGNTCLVIIPQNRLESKKIEDVRKYCKEKKVPVFIQPQDDREMLSFCDSIKNAGCTFAVSWCYSQIIRKPVLDLFPSGIWNMHGGKIPEYRGANVLQWAIVNNEREIGVTWHLMDEKIDHGPLLKEGSVVIGENDNAISVRDKVMQLGFDLFQELWKEAETEGICPYEADMSRGRYWKPRNIYDGIIHDNMSEQDIRNLLRAQCPPWPEPIYYDRTSGVYRIKGIVKEPDTGNTILFQNDKCRLWLRAVLEKDEEIIENVRSKENCGNTDY